MLTKRSFIIFNLGLALVFLLIGALSHYALSLTQPAHLQGAGRLINQDNIQSIKNDEDIEHVRAKALYYLELAHGLQQSKYEEADRKYYDVRLLSTFAIIAFLVETIMIALWQSKTLSKTSPKGESA